MTSVPSDMKYVDIDNVIENFNKWQKYTSDVERERSSLTDQLGSVKQLLTQTDERSKVRKQEMQEMKDTVDKLHAVLNQRCDLEDENGKLKEEIKNLNKKLKDQAMENEQKIASAQEDLKKHQKLHVADLERLKEEMNENAERNQGELQTVIDRKEEEIEELNKKLQNLEKEKQAELIKVSLEYDSKLMKMQKQNAHLQTAHANSSHQDLFRKKLMHAKEEANREISSLKRTISDLQQRLQQQQQQKPSNIGPSNAKRMRRY